MACCGRTSPLGAGTQKSRTSAKTTTTTTKTTEASKTPSPPKVQRTPTSAPTTASSFQTFTLEQRDGSTQTFGSRLEAEAARIRSGGGIVK